jgi:hypothetical protein
MTGPGSLWTRLHRHVRVFGAAFLFAMVAYGLVHLLYWGGKLLFGWAPN